MSALHVPIHTLVSGVMGKDFTNRPLDVRFKFSVGWEVQYASPCAVVRMKLGYR